MMNFKRLHSQITSQDRVYLKYRNIPLLVLKFNNASNNGLQLVKIPNTKPNFKKKLMNGTLMPSTPTKFPNFQEKRIQDF